MADDVTAGNRGAIFKFYRFGNENRRPIKQQSKETLLGKEWPRLTKRPICPRNVVREWGALYIRVCVFISQVCVSTWLRSRGVKEYSRRFYALLILFLLYAVNLRLFCSSLDPLYSLLRVDRLCFVLFRSVCIFGYILWNWFQIM